ncbi:hypothetical protein [Halocola ammonii]
MSKSVYIKILVPAFLISVVFYSCGGLKPAASNSGKDLYESFYAGDGTTRYFIKPLELESQEENLLIDFNVESNEGDTATALFSVYSEEPLKSIDRLTFSNDDMEKSTQEVDKMFIELEKKNYESRYSVRIPNRDLKGVFANHNWTLTIESDGKKMSFTPARKTMKKINTLNKAVFMLVE